MLFQALEAGTLLLVTIFNLVDPTTAEPHSKVCLAHVSAADTLLFECTVCSAMQITASGCRDSRADHSAVFWKLVTTLARECSVFSRLARGVNFAKAVVQNGVSSGAQQFTVGVAAPSAL